MSYVDIFDTNNKYDIIYTDPPWKQNRGGKKSARPNSSGKELDYPTMELEEIELLHKQFLGNCAEKRHNVFCWTTEKHLRDTEEMFEHLNYKLHLRMIWSKCGMGQAPAFTLRYSHEYLLWFYPAGNMYKMDTNMRGKYPSVIEAKPRKHSQKPDEFYEFIENCFPNSSRIELFARNTRNGWDCWGNEVSA